MELLVDVRHVETHFGPLGDNVGFGARQVHSLHQTYHRLRNHFGHTRGSPRRRGCSGSSIQAV
jgi:hypothetical protein